MVSLRLSVPWLLCNIGLSVSGLRKIRFNAYTLRRISTKKSVPKQTRIPIVRVDNFSLVSLCFPVPWFIVLSVWVSAVYAKYVSTPIHPVEFPPKKISSQTDQDSRCPINNFSLVSLRFSVPWFTVIGLSVSGLRKIRFNAYTPCQISTKKNQFPNKPGFPLLN